ncbi:hypothetical protein DMC30DRAFT_333387, partial [Rhodotorula diobovata]
PAAPHSSSSSSLPPMPPHPFPGTFPPPPGLDDILRHPQRPPAPHIGRPRRPPMTTERYDERCWTSTRQTNARRALGRDPQVSMYCYINMRNALEDLVPVPGHPTAFLARDAGPTPDHLPAVRRKGAKSDRPEGVPEYHWPWLDGRFVYVARGRDNVARHMREMGGGAAAEDPKAPSPSARRRRTSLQHGATPAAAAAAAAVEGERVGAWETIQRIEDRVEKQEADKLLPGKREERILRRAMGFEDDSSENLISLSDAYSSTLQRLHAHLVRIYSPGLRNLARVPEVWTDGTAATMVDTVATRLTDGSAFRLVGRMWDSLGSVHAQLEERRKRRGGGGEGDPFGGSQPPVVGGGAGPGLPPLPPLPPPAAGAPR